MSRLAQLHEHLQPQRASIESDHACIGGHQQLDRQICCLSKLTHNQICSSNASDLLKQWHASKVKKGWLNAWQLLNRLPKLIFVCNLALHWLGTRLLHAAQ